MRAFASQVKAQTQQVVMGHDQAIDLMLVALLSKGHVLLEGVPGTAKTLLARTFAASLDLAFKRIQFTPDLMPGDIIGTSLFNFQTNRFSLTKGPIFTDVLLADEINRTPPKTQAALLEAMQERTVTIDGESHALGEHFMVIATQNPIEQQGTYPLPEAQLDRFLFKIKIDYPSLEQEREIIMLHGHQTSTSPWEALKLLPLVRRKELERFYEVIAQIRLSEDVVDYVARLIRSTREHNGLLCGASPRAAAMLAAASRCYATLQGRDYVIPDDVKQLAFPILRHRLPLAAGAEIEGTKVETIINHIIDQVAAPR